MLETKLFEVRDKNTFIPVVAIFWSRSEQELNNEESYLLGRAGYGKFNDCILLTYLSSGAANYDPYQWGNRTMQTAHSYIEDNWEELQSGEVVDVEFILKETKEPKISEMVEEIIERTDKEFR